MKLLCIRDVTYADPQKVGQQRALYRENQVVECHVHADCIHDESHFRLLDETVTGEWFFSHFEFLED